MDCSSSFLEDCWIHFLVYFVAQIAQFGRCVPLRYYIMVSHHVLCHGTLLVYGGLRVYIWPMKYAVLHVYWNDVPPVFSGDAIGQWWFEGIYLTNEICRTICILRWRTNRVFRRFYWSVVVWGSISDQWNMLLFRWRTNCVLYRVFQFINGSLV